MVQIASLGLKTANAIILKGGKEAAHSNAALVKAIQQGLQDAGLPGSAVQLVESRQQVCALYYIYNSIIQCYSIYCFNI